METIPGVSVRYVKNAQELKDPDMIVLPGSKNTISDLLWMRQNGLEAAILKQAGSGKVVFGICGGYQMLGETLSDPLGLETSGTVRGMGLLPIDTVFMEEKTRTRVTGTFLTEGTLLAGLQTQKLAAEGYEIHMGQSTRKDGARPLLTLTERGKRNGQAGWRLQRKCIRLLRPWAFLTAQASGRLSFRPLPTKRCADGGYGAA